MTHDEGHGCESLTYIKRKVNSSWLGKTEMRGVTMASITQRSLPVNLYNCVVSKNKQCGCQRLLNLFFCALLSMSCYDGTAAGTCLGNYKDHYYVPEIHFF